MKRLAVCLLTLSSMVLSAHAQDRLAADAAFRDGRTLMKKGKYAEACEKFRLSQKLDPSAGTLLNLGLCNEKLGRLATAYLRVNEAADLASRSGDTNRAQKFRAYARSIEPRLTRLLIRLEDDKVPGVKVTRDGADVTLLLDTAVPVDPGTYTVAVTAPNAKPWSSRVVAREEGKTIAVVVPQLEVVEKPPEHEPSATTTQPDAEPIEEPSTASPDRPEANTNSEVQSTSSLSSEVTVDQPAHDSNRTRRRIALGIGIGGAVATAIGLGFGWRAHSQFNDSKSFCEQNVCTEEGLELIDSSFTNANIANAAVGVGIAAVIGAGVLWYLSRDSAPPTTSSRLTPHASGDQLGLSLVGTF